MEILYILTSPSLVCQNLNSLNVTINQSYYPELIRCPLLYIIYNAQTAASTVDPYTRYILSRCYHVYSSWSSVSSPSKRKAQNCINNGRWAVQMLDHICQVDKHATSWPLITDSTIELILVQHHLRHHEAGDYWCEHDSSRRWCSAHVLCACAISSGNTFNRSQSCSHSQKR